MADLGAGRKGREVGRFSSPSVIRLSPIPARRAASIWTAILLLPGCWRPRPNRLTCSLCSACGPARI